ncbi:hypothetical protein [Pandoraea oxalativorans]|nr:hypothetical protein [Pandoraea oxalativorans]
MASARDELLALLRTLNLSAMGEAVEVTALRAAKEGLRSVGKSGSQRFVQ